MEGPGAAAGAGGSNVPAFLTKLWTLVEDPDTDPLICWSPDQDLNTEITIEFLYTPTVEMLWSWSSISELLVWERLRLLATAI